VPSLGLKERGGMTLWLLGANLRKTRQSGENETASIEWDRGEWEKKKEGRRLGRSGLKLKASGGGASPNHTPSLSELSLPKRKRKVCPCSFGGK